MQQTAPVSTAIVFVLALNLRPAVTSLGAALEDVSLAPGMTAAIGAVLVALPLWASGIGGWITPWLRARIGIHRAVTWALIILGISLVVRVQSGAEVLIAGTALACLAIAVVGTVLPVLVQPASSGTKACFTLALGAGSTIGALVTPTLVAAFSWQFALAGWALLAVVTVHVWQRAPRSSMVFMVRALSPRQLFHSRVAWHLTVYFGLVSTLTFLIMGWLPAILRDAGISAGYAGFCLALSMAMGLPMMWLVPFGVHRMRRPGILVVLLAALNGVGVVGLLVAPAAMPWLWSTGLGLGMGGLAMALTTISVRAAGIPDVTTALSGMVQGLGYFIAGAGALACGLVHSATGSWEWPLIMALFVLCGQVWCGVQAARPILVAPRPIAELEPARVEPDLTHLTNGVRVTAQVQPEHLTNGVRVTAQAEPEPLTNGVRVTAQAEPEPLTNGVRVTAQAEPQPEPDVTQPVKGVWITAVTELESVKPELDVAQLTNGVRVTALSESEPDSAQPPDGVRVAAVTGPELDVAELSDGVRVTALSGSDPDLADSADGVRATASGGSELDVAELSDGVRVTALSESDVAQLTNGVRVTALSASDSVGPELDVAQPPDEGVLVAALSGADPDLGHSANGVGATAPGESEPDLVQPPDGVRVAAASGSESDLAELSEGVRVTAESDLTRPVNGVRVTAESDLTRPVNGVRVTAVGGQDFGLLPFTNGAGVRVPSRSAPDLPQQADGVRVTAVSGQPANGTRAPGEPEKAVPRPVNGVRVTAKVQPSANGVRATVGGQDFGLLPFTNGAGVRVPIRPILPESDLAHAANGVRGMALSESEVARLTSGAQVTGPPKPEPGSPVTTTEEPEPGLTDLSSEVQVLAEAAIPLPRQPGGPFIGPPAAPPIVETIHSETATQEG
jgi:CP family cyanate transporter-like MFS transporter